MKRFWFLSVIALVARPTAAWSAEFLTGLFPEAAITKRLENGRSLTFKVEHQQTTYDKDDEPSSQFTRYRTDWMAFYDAKISDSNSIGHGKIISCFPTSRSSACRIFRRPGLTERAEPSGRKWSATAYQNFRRGNAKDWLLEPAEK